MKLNKYFWRCAGVSVLVLFLLGVCALPAKAAWTYKPPPCMPDKFSDVRYKLYDTLLVTLYYCDTPRGIIPVSRAFNLARGGRPVNITGRTDAELYALDKFAIVRELTETEKDLVGQLAAAQGVSGKVINPGYTTAPLYYANADGTKGATVKEYRWDVGKPCSLHKRLVSLTGKGTDYYYVADYGGKELYARCAVTGVVSK